MILLYIKTPAAGIPVSQMTIANKLILMIELDSPLCYIISFANAAVKAKH